MAEEDDSSRRPNGVNSYYITRVQLYNQLHSIPIHEYSELISSRCYAQAHDNLPSALCSFLHSFF